MVIVNTIVITRGLYRFGAQSVGFALAAFGVGGYLVLSDPDTCWPRLSTRNLSHTHTDLPSDHPHLLNVQHQTDGSRHSHKVVIDELHHCWPTNG